MSVSQAPTRAYPPRRRVPGTCSTCPAPIMIAENRVNLPNYCKACRKAANVMYSRAQREMSGYQERHNQYQREHSRIARELQNRPQYPADPDRAGYWLVPCSDCRRPVSTHPSRAYGRRVCEVCGRERKNELENARYHAKKASGYVQYTPPSPARKAAQALRRFTGPALPNGGEWLQLEHDISDFRRSAVFVRSVWEEMAQYGDLNGAVLLDRNGGRWIIDGLTVVRA